MYVCILIWLARRHSVKCPAFCSGGLWVWIPSESGCNITYYIHIYFIYMYIYLKKYLAINTCQLSPITQTIPKLLNIRTDYRVWWFQRYLFIIFIICKLNKYLYILLIIITIRTNTYVRTYLLRRYSLAYIHMYIIIMSYYN